MAESAEHDFLKHAVNDVLQKFSSLKLYTFTETDRRTFDFSSLIDRDWKRPVVGQVLWKHEEGLEKDIRTLANDTDSDIKVYIAKNEMKYQRAFSEIVTDYRRSGKHNDLFKLKPIWVPADFDADKLQDQALVSDHIQNSVVTDILFNVVFGRITDGDVQFVLNTSGVGGLQLAILYIIANRGFVNIAALSHELVISPGPIREKLVLLAGSGMIESPRGAIRYTITAKGRVLLDIVKRVAAAKATGVVDDELGFVLGKLGCPPVSWETVGDHRDGFPYIPFVALVRMISDSRRWINPEE